MLPELVDLLISTATVMRAEPVEDGMGGTKSPYTLKVADAVSCRVSFPKAAARDKVRMDNKDAVITMCTIFTEYRTDLKARDRFIIVTDFGTEVYQSEDPNDPGKMHHHLEWPCRKIV